MRVTNEGGCGWSGGCVRVPRLEGALCVSVGVGVCGARGVSVMECACVRGCCAACRSLYLSSNLISGSFPSVVSGLSSLQ